MPATKGAKIAKAEKPKQQQNIPPRRRRTVRAQPTVARIVQL